MNNSINPPPNSNHKATPNTIESDLTGKIASNIGTGKNAKDSFIWMSITWSFCIASGLSLLVFGKLCFDEADPSDVIDSITDIWSIFIPIVTLALGYAFGKGQ